MSNFPTLYKRTKTGAIQQWTVAAVDGIIEKRAGQLGGKLTLHEEVATPKNVGRSNETTAYQQAESQALSDWTKKHDEGYKSLEDLGSTDTEADWLIDGTQHEFDEFYRWLNVALPQFNTDANGNVKPMLAKAVDWSKVTYPCLVQPKLDGVRCLMVVKSYHTSADITFLSRNGKEYTTLDHIKSEVVKYIAGSEKEFILDGEIYSDEITFQEIIAAVKKQRPDSLKLKFRAYDVVSEDIQRVRWLTTKALVDSIASPLVQAVETVDCTDKSQIKIKHDQWVSEGNEGAMIRLRNGIYGQGQRSSSLMKVKEFDTNEFTFINMEVGQREEDLIAVCENNAKQQFRAKIIGNRAYKAILKTECGDLQNTPITIKHFGLTDDGLPRFPIGVGFRDYE